MFGEILLSYSELRRRDLYCETDKVILNKNASGLKRKTAANLNIYRTRP